MPDPAETLADTLRDIADSPVSDCVEIIASALVPVELILPVASSPEAGSGGAVRLMVSQDNEGRCWAHFYADIQSASMHLEKGTKVTRMSFADAFRLIASDEAFGGFRVDSGAEWTVLPRAFFDRIEAVLAE